MIQCLIHEMVNIVMRFNIFSDKVMEYWKYCFKNHLN